MGIQRTHAARVVVVLLVTGVAWFLWPRAAESPRAASPLRAGAEAEGRKPGLATAPGRTEPKPVAEKAPTEPPAGNAPVAPPVPEGGILEGEVRDAEGHLAVGVVVTALEPDEPLPPRRQRYMWYVFEKEIAEAKGRQRSAVTDAAGRFEIRGVPLETEVNATVYASDPLDGRSEPVTFTTVGERQRRDVRMPVPGSVVVQVVGWKEGDERRHGLTLRGPTGWHDSFDQEALKEGAWIVEGLRPGTYEVHVWLPDAPLGAREIEVRAGERTLVEIVRPAGKAVDGLVVDGKGDPVADAHVWWVGAEMVVGSTDKAGRFHFNGLTGDAGKITVGTFDFRSDDFARAVVPNVVPGGDPVRIVLPSAPHLVGRVVGVDPQARVRKQVISSSLFLGAGDAPPGDGKFEIAVPEIDVPSLLLLEVEGFAPRVVEVDHLKAGERRDLGELRFDQGRAMSGVVRDESGAPVAGATVIVAEKWREEERVTTEDGAFRFERMPDRATTIRVNAVGFPVHIVTVPAGADGERPTIRISQGGRLSIRVVDAAGAAVPGAEVHFMPDGPSPYDVDYDKTRRHRPTDERGRLEVQLQARGHRMSVYDEKGKRSGEVERVVVKEGEASSIEIRIR